MALRLKEKVFQCALPKAEVASPDSSGKEEPVGGWVCVCCWAWYRLKPIYLLVIDCHCEAQTELALLPNRTEQPLRGLDTWTPFPLSDGLDSRMLTFPDAFSSMKICISLSRSHQICLSSTYSIPGRKGDLQPLLHSQPFLQVPTLAQGTVTALTPYQKQGVLFSCMHFRT